MNKMINIKLKDGICEPRIIKVGDMIHKRSKYYLILSVEILDDDIFMIGYDFRGRNEVKIYGKDLLKDKNSGIYQYTIKQTRNITRRQRNEESLDIPVGTYIDPKISKKGFSFAENVLW